MPSPYSCVLVPLDGSPLAESAIHDAVSIAETSGAEVVLLHVVEPPPGVTLDEEDGALAEDARLEEPRARGEAYLDGVRHRIAGRPVNVGVVVEVGTPADEIVSCARDRGVDLVVMATHGRTGVTRFLLGSVAGKVIQRAAVPVLLVRVPRGPRSDGAPSPPPSSS